MVILSDKSLISVYAGYSGYNSLASAPTTYATTNYINSSVDNTSHDTLFFNSAIGATGSVLAAFAIGEIVTFAPVVVAVTAAQGAVYGAGVYMLRCSLQENAS